MNDCCKKWKDIGQERFKDGYECFNWKRYCPNCGHSLEDTEWCKCEHKFQANSLRCGYCHKVVKPKSATELPNIIDMSHSHPDHHHATIIATINEIRNYIYLKERE